MEKENYRTLIESLENDTYIVETNLSEMEANINLLTAGSNMMYKASDDLDSAFSSNASVAPAMSSRRPIEEDDWDDEDEDDDDIDVYGDNSDDEDDDDFDDFLDD